MLISDKRICEECGREFTITDAGNWAYKLPHGHRGTVSAWYCRYNCLRSAEKKRDEKKKRVPKKEEEVKVVKIKKPLKYVLEDDLKAGLTIAQITKKYEVSVQTIHNWIKSYELTSYVRGHKGPKVEPEAVDVAQPTLIQIEQFHTDEQVQALPDVEMDKAVETTPQPNPGCFGDYNPGIYWCHDCEYKAGCLTMFNKLNPGPQGMTEEENMSDEVWEDEKKREWDTQKAEWDALDQSDHPENYEVTEEVAKEITIEEKWDEIENALLDVHVMYIRKAERDFEERMLRTMKGELG